MAQHIAILLLLVSPLAMRASSAVSACAGEKFPPGRTYATCEDLPQLGAALHWTYDKATSSLSLAFVAATSGPSGWVAWGLNPTGEGMAGTQALVALKSSSSAPAVKTYNITGYAPLAGDSTPIAFPATDLAADSGSGGKIRLYGKLKLIKGMKAVNHVWQVGSSVSGGAPSKHSFAAGNLAAKATLVLAGSSTAPNAISRGPSSSSRSDGDDDAAKTTTPSTRKSVPSAPTAGLSAVALIAAFALRAVVPPPRVRFIPISISFWLNVIAVACFCYGMFIKDPYFKYTNEAGFFFSCDDKIGYLCFWYREPNNAAVLPTTAVVSATPAQGATHHHVIELPAHTAIIQQQQQPAEVIEITAVI